MAPMTTNKNPQTQADRDAAQDAAHQADEDAARAEGALAPWGPGYASEQFHAALHEDEAAVHEAQGNHEVARDHRRWAAQHQAHATNAN